MRLAILLALLGVLTWFLIRWFTGHRQPLILAVLTCLVLPLTGLEARWIYREHRYTGVVRDLIGNDAVKVHCQRTMAYLVDVSGLMGYVPYPPDRVATDAYLRNDTCAALAGYVAQPHAPTPEQVRAVHILTHEAMHLAGQRNEAAAECMAMQRNHLTARALGATTEQAHAAARAYYARLYPLVPDQYRDAECRPGGGLDEGLPDPPWQPAGSPRT